MSTLFLKTVARISLHCTFIVNVTVKYQIDTFSKLNARQKALVLRALSCVPFKTKTWPIENKDFAGIKINIRNTLKCSTNSCLLFWMLSYRKPDQSYPRTGWLVLTYSTKPFLSIYNLQVYFLLPFLTLATQLIPSMRNFTETDSLFIQSYLKYRICV